jgi:hypothetical protein
MPDTERLEAKGPRGEACVIIRTWTRSGGEDAGGRGVPSYRLATGERLNQTEDASVFVTLDSARKFVLRQ